MRLSVGDFRGRAMRRLCQAVCLVLFALSLLLPATAGVWMRLDVLSGLSAMLATRRFLPSFWPALGMVALALVVGRAWCGWMCPLGTLLEWTGRRRARRPPPRFWRWPKYALLAAVLASSLLRFPYPILLDPMPLLGRAVGVVRLAVSLGILAPLADLAPLLLLGAVLALNLAAPRFWCHAFCPLGAALALLGRLAFLQRRLDDRCNACGTCARLCPTGVAEGDAHPSECLICLQCASHCPAEAVHWRSRRSGQAQAFDPARRAFLAALGAGALASLLMPLARYLAPRQPRWLRPPGAREGELQMRCLRCGACLAVCPTGALRPLPLSSGLEAFWTPHLTPRLGYCRYSCNACGKACPSGAIPPLSLAEKQRAVIGLARVDPSRCLTWTENRRCTVCHDTCPVPGGAIRLVEETAVTPRGEGIRLRRPHVQEERCNGCGICEYNCPVQGEAGIRVWPVWH